MSLKYMWLIGLINDKDAEMLQAPVDRLILKGTVQNEKYEGYAWSRLPADKYDEIQGKIENMKKDKTVIEWECDAWIKQSKLEKRKGNKQQEEE